MLDISISLLIDGVIVILREELDISRETVMELEQEMGILKKQLSTSRAQSELDIDKSCAEGPGARELLEMTQRLASTRREYQDMRHSTVQELKRVKQEMEDKSREMTTACLETFTRGQYITDSEGKQVFVGTNQELWERLERIRSEKKVEQERADMFEVEKEQALREVNSMGKKINEMKSIINQQNYMDESKEDTDGTKIESRLGNLTAENALLRSSIQDIASLVKTDNTQHSSLNMSSGRPRPLLPMRYSSLNHNFR